MPCGAYSSEPVLLGHVMQVLAIHPNLFSRSREVPLVPGQKLIDEGHLELGYSFVLYFTVASISWIEPNRDL